MVRALNIHSLVIHTCTLSATGTESAPAKDWSGVKQLLCSPSGIFMGWESAANGNYLLSSLVSLCQLTITLIFYQLSHATAHYQCIF